MKINKIKVSKLFLQPFFNREDGIDVMCKKFEVQKSSCYLRKLKHRFHFGC